MRNRATALSLALVACNGQRPAPDAAQQLSSPLVTSTSPAVFTAPLPVPAPGAGGNGAGQFTAAGGVEAASPSAAAQRAERNARPPRKPWF